MSSTTAATPIKEHSFSRDYSWYLVANVSVMLAGMVSLPITSRYLSRYDFGLLGVFETLSALWVGVLKLGLQHSLLRFHPTECLDRPLSQRKRFYATFVWVPQLFSIPLTGLAVFGAGIAVWARALEHGSMLCAVLVLSQLVVLSSYFQNAMVAERMARENAFTESMLRWLQVLFTVITLFFIARSAVAITWARVLASALVFIWLIFWGRKVIPAKMSQFSPELFRDAIAFGIPLSLSEIATLIHGQIDRLLLKGYLDFSAVGLYHINYSVASYLGMVMFASFAPAFTPHANRIYDKEGPAEYRERMRTLVRPLIYITALVIASVYLIGQDLLVIVIGRDKANLTIFGLVALTYAVTPLCSSLSHGLTLEKKSGLIMYTLLLSCGVNIGVNIALIPRYQILGAAYATVASFAVLWSTRLILTSRRLIPVKVGDFVLPTGVAAFYFLVSRTALTMLSLPVVGRIGCVALAVVLLFALPALLLDRELRTQVSAKVHLKLHRE